MTRRWPVVSFDAGGTLLEPWPSVGHVYADSAASLGLGPVDAQALNQQFAAAWRRPSAGTFDYSRSAWADIVARSFAGLVPQPDSPDLFHDAYARFTHPSAWRVFTEVRTTLQTLHDAGVRLIVTSNWDERLPRLLTDLALAPYFEWIAVSAEIGFHKPDSRCFHAVTTRLGVSAKQILHVGDSLREDIDGARAAGWSAVQICRRSPPPASTDALRSLQELIPQVLGPDRAATR